MSIFNSLLRTAAARTNHYGAFRANGDLQKLAVSGSAAPTHTVGMEDSVGTVREIEYVVYGRLTDFDQLNKAASCIKHEQWELRIPRTEKNAADGRIRVRKTELDGGEPNYELTTKMRAERPSKENPTSQSFEINQPCTEDQFIAVRFMAEQGMIKHRFNFPIVGSELVWEVDVFPNGNGGYHEWVKIDLEVKAVGDRLPELPLNLADVILPEGMGELSSEEREEKITTIYGQCFLATNPYLKKEEPTEPVTPEITGDGEDPKVNQPGDEDDNNAAENKTGDDSGGSSGNAAEPDGAEEVDADGDDSGAVAEPETGEPEES